MKEGKQLSTVLNHPAFQVDPLAAINQHLESTQRVSDEKPKKKMNKNGSKKRKGKSKTSDRAQSMDVWLMSSRLGEYANPTPTPTPDHHHHSATPTEEEMYSFVSSFVHYIIFFEIIKLHYVLQSFVFDLWSNFVHWTIMNDLSKMKGKKNYHKGLIILKLCIDFVQFLYNLLTCLVQVYSTSFSKCHRSINSSAVDYNSIILHQINSRLKNSVCCLSTNGSSHIPRGCLST